MIYIRAEWLKFAMLILHYNELPLSVMQILFAPRLYQLVQPFLTYPFFSAYCPSKVCYKSFQEK
ncbi:MAG: hypothetical protein ACXW0I_01550 [Methylosarcina sp.]